MDLSVHQQIVVVCQHYKSSSWPWDSLSAKKNTKQHAWRLVSLVAEQWNKFNKKSNLANGEKVRMPKKDVPPKKGFKKCLDDRVCQLQAINIHFVEGRVETINIKTILLEKSKVKDEVDFYVESTSSMKKYPETLRLSFATYLDSRFN